MRFVTDIIWALFSVAIHICIGMACYAWQVGDAINPASATFWSWVGAWPLMLIVTFWGVVWKAALGMVAAFIALVLVCWLFYRADERKKAGS